MKKTLICWNDCGDEVQIVDIDGTLYKVTEGDAEPMRFNTHDGGGDGPDGDVLSHANVQLCGWEVEEDSSRNFCSCVCLPSDCFTSDIGQKDGLTEDAIEAIKEWAEADLEIADKAAEESLKPLEKDGIEEDFTRFLDEDYESMHPDGAPDDDETKATDYLEEVQNFRREYVPGFHDDDEVLEICRNYLKK